ncbi:MAG: Cof-type HAD-IIB family hydrolase [Culicoidibacterales bacterium]
MYKMLVTDIDDTLLNSDHQLSPENLVAITSLLEKKHTFVLASGRPDGGMADLVKEIGLDKVDGYIIAFNGGKIKNVATGEILYQVGLEQEHFKRVVHFAQENKLSICSYTDTEIVVSRESEQSKIEAQLTGLTYVVTADICAYFEKKLIPKSIIFGEAAIIAQMKPKLLEAVGQDLEVVISKPIFLEITPKGVHKGSAILTLAEKLGIEASEIIAVGDGENDLEMLKAAGLGIAVENAQDTLKSVADIVTVSNNEHAIALIAKTYFI